MTMTIMSRAGECVGGNIREANTSEALSGATSCCQAFSGEPVTEPALITARVAKATMETFMVPSSGQLIKTLQ